jgi:hypothetical protein
MDAHAAAAEPDRPALLDELVRRHGAHTVLLYGSYARGQATPSSDLDLIALRPGAAARDLEPWRGLALDVHLHPEEAEETIAEKQAPSLRDARVLRQRGDLGDRLLAAVRARLAAPPPPLAAGEQAALWAWGDKMRTRVQHPDPLVRAVQRATLLVEALPAWAQVRGCWFFGPKAALRSMAHDDPHFARAFTAAAAPDAFLGLLDAVFDPSLPRPAAAGPV